MKLFFPTVSSRTKSPKSLKSETKTEKPPKQEQKANVSSSKVAVSGSVNKRTVTPPVIVRTLEFSVGTHAWIPRLLDVSSDESKTKVQNLQELRCVETVGGRRVATTIRWVNIPERKDREPKYKPSVVPGIGPIPYAYLIEHITDSHIRHFRRLPPSLLKSMLQKNIRLRRPNAAARCAVELAIVSTLEELVRRIMVIIIEDGILHPCYAYLCWLMCGLAKSFVQPTEYHINTCIYIVYQLAELPYKDHTAATAPAEGSALRLATVKTLTKPLVRRPDEETLVNCLLVRACYGGMNGDLTMLRHAAATWQTRFATDSYTFDHLLNIYSLDDDITYALRFGSVRIDDIVLSGVDFHCCPDILESLHGTRYVSFCKSHLFIKRQ